MPTTVTITPGPNGPTVHPERAEINMQGEVQWVCAGGGEFTVDFPANCSLFNEHRFNKQHPNSGHPKQKGECKYSVTVNEKTLDPIVVVS